MSSLRNRGNSNPHPCKIWVNVHCGEKSKGFFDHRVTSNDGREEAYVKIDLPFKFIPFACVVTVGGYNEAKKCYLGSTEVHQCNREPLKVYFRNKEREEIAQGLWKDIKEKVGYKQGKFQYRWYAYVPTTEGLCSEPSFTGIQWSSCSTGDIIEMKEKFLGCWCQVDGFRRCEKGETVYYAPNISIVSDELEADVNDVVFDMSDAYDIYYEAATKGSGSEDPGDSQEREGSDDIDQSEAATGQIANPFA